MAGLRRAADVTRHGRPPWVSANTNACIVHASECINGPEYKGKGQSNARAFFASQLALLATNQRASEAWF